MDNAIFVGTVIIALFVLGFLAVNFFPASVPEKECVSLCKVFNGSVGVIKDNRCFCGNEDNYCGAGLEKQKNIQCKIW